MVLDLAIGARLDGDPCFWSETVLGDDGPGRPDGDPAVCRQTPVLAAFSIVSSAASASAKSEAGTSGNTDAMTEQ